MNVYGGKTPKYLVYSYSAIFMKYNDKGVSESYVKFCSTLNYS